MAFWGRLLLRDAPPPAVSDAAGLALAVLLVRLARADDHYHPAEIARIDRVLGRRYGLDTAGAADLRRQAEVLEGQALDTVRFTRALKAAVPPEERRGLIAALWAVALADGARDGEEERVIRLVAGLLGVTDVESGLARQQVAREMAAGTGPGAAPDPKN